MLKRQKSVAGRETAASETDSMVSVKTGPVYVGLSGEKTGRFEGFENEKLYGFPVISGENIGNKYTISAIDIASLVPVLSHLHSVSPFRRSDHLDLCHCPSGYQPPANTSITDSSHESSWSSMVPRGKDCSSLDLTPIKVVDNSVSTVGDGRKVWRSYRQAWGVCEPDSSWEEALDKGSRLVELLPEDSLMESKEMFRSTDALIKAGIIKEVPEDLSSSSDELNISAEPEALVPLPSQAKPHLPVFHPIPAKILPDSLCEESMEIDAKPDGFSPLVRKCVVCEERHAYRTAKSLQILQSFPCSGYRCTLTLQFSSGSHPSTAIIEEDKEPLRLPVLLLTPRIMRWGLSNPITWMSCGFEHVAIVTVEGDVFTWGYGSAGVLGHGDLRSYPEPTRVRALSNISYIDCGGYHTAALSSDGRLWTWGRGDVNQLGLNPSRLTPDEFGCYANWPIEIEDFRRVKRTVKSVACGEAHTLVVCSKGTVWACGWAEDGQLGLPYSFLTSEGTMSSQFAEVPGVSNAIKVSAGALFSAAVTSTGSVLTWGNGDQGQLGLGTQVRSTERPMVVSGVTDAVDVVCGENYCICLTAGGKAYGWGSGLAGRFDNGQFAPGAPLVCYVPRQLGAVNIPHLLKIRRATSPQSDFLSSLQEELLQLEMED